MNKYFMTKKNAKTNYDQNNMNEIIMVKIKMV